MKNCRSNFNSFVDSIKLNNNYFKTRAEPKICFGLLLIVIICACSESPDKFSFNEKEDTNSVLFLPTAKFLPNGFNESSSELHSSIYFSNNGNSLFYTVQTYNDSTKKYSSQIVKMEYANGKWSVPETVSFLEKYNDSFVALSPDGITLYFKSNRPKPESSKLSGRIWTTEIQNKTFSEPEFIGSPVSGLDKTSSFSISSKGNFYLYQNGPKEEGWGEIYLSSDKSNFVKLPETINSNAYEALPQISPNENYLFFYRMTPEGISGLFISNKLDNDNWSDAKYLPESVNKGGLAFDCSFSPDGKYLFYLLRKDKKLKSGIRKPGIYRVRIDQLKRF